MKIKDLNNLLSAIQSTISESDTVEVKTARGGTPKRLYEALSAFANHTGGGIISFGLDESKDFSIVGVGDAHRLQEEITSLASNNMDPALRPEFTVDDRRASFQVTFHNHTLMTTEAVSWLNQFSHLPLNDHQRLALVYLRQHSYIDNRDYRRLNRVDVITAGQDLRGLVQSDLIEQLGFGRWTKYILKIQDERAKEPRIQSHEETILTHVKKQGSINNTECRDLLEIDLQKASYLLKKLTKKGLLKRVGERRWTQYQLL